MCVCGLEGCVWVVRRVECVWVDGVFKTVFHY